MTLPVSARTRGPMMALLLLAACGGAGSPSGGGAGSNGAAAGVEVGGQAGAVACAVDADCGPGARCVEDKAGEFKQKRCTPIAQEPASDASAPSPPGADAGVTVTTTACGGVAKGTVDDPYLICTVDDLELLRAHPAAAFAIVNDLNLSARSFAPIDVFEGQLDGRGHVIEGFHVTGTAPKGEIAFFRLVKGATIEHLTLAHVDVNATDAYHVGGLVGRSWGPTRIHDCHVSGSVRGTNIQWHIAGLVGGMDAFDVPVCGVFSNLLTQAPLVSSSSADVVVRAVSTGPTPSKTYSTGALVGGGGAGHSRYVIIDSFALGDVSGNDVHFEGGLTGGAGGGNSGAIVHRSFAAVKLTTSTTPGAVLKLKGQYGQVSSSFFDLSLAGPGAVTEGATGLSPAAMETTAPFQGAGWSSTWTLVDGARPSLPSQPPRPSRNVECSDGTMAELAEVCALTSACP